METQNQTGTGPDETPTFTSDEDLQAGYFIQTLSSFWQRTDLSLEAKGLYALLLTYAGKNDRSWPGQARLSEQTGLSKNTLRERIDELSGLGLLTVTRRGQGKPNLYHLHSATVKPTGSNSGNPEAQNLNIKKRNNYTSRSSGIAHELYSEETYSINNSIPPRENHVLPIKREKPEPTENKKIAQYFAKAISSHEDTLSSMDYKDINRLVDEGFTLERCKPGIDETVKGIRSRSGGVVRTFRVCEKSIRQLDPTIPIPISIQQSKAPTQEDLDREADMDRWYAKRKAQMDQWHMAQPQPQQPQTAAAQA